MAKTTLKNIIENETFLVLPGVHDCLTAKLAERAGAKAIFLSGGALSITSLGRPDIGFLSLGDFITAARNIAGAVDIPLISDADNGFGNAVHAANSASALERIGVAGMQIDDQILPQSVPTTSKERLEWRLVRAKIRAARENVSESFVLIFRTIANISDDLDEALRRASGAVSAGADYVYVDGLKSFDEIERVARCPEVGGKLLINMNEKGAAANLPIERIKALGYRIGLFPVSAMAASAKAVEAVFSDLMSHESTASQRDNMSNPADVYNMMGLNALTEKNLRLYD